MTNLLTHKETNPQVLSSVVEQGEPRNGEGLTPPARIQNSIFTECRVAEKSLHDGLEPILPITAEYDPDRNKDEFFRTLKQLRIAVQAEELPIESCAWDETEALFRLSYENMASPEFVRQQLRQQGTTAAFVVHQRTPPEPATQWAEGEAELADVSRHFPALNKAIITGNTPQLNALYDALTAHIPPTIIGKLGMQVGNDRVDLALIASAVSPALFPNGRKFNDALRDARARALFASDILDAWGLKTSGWGAMHGAMTHGATELTKRHPDHLITPGHTATTYAIAGTLEKVCTNVGLSEKERRIGMIGAMGSICGSVTALLIQEAAQSRRTSPIVFQVDRRYTSGVRVVDGIFQASDIDEVMQESGYVGDANVLISAASAPGPFMKVRHFKGIRAGVDDGQPPAASRSVIDNARSQYGTAVSWPSLAGSGSTRLYRDFDYGLLEGTEFGCAVEAMVLADARRQGIDLGYDPTGPVTPEKVNTFALHAQRLGIVADGLQNFARPTI